MNVMRPYKIKEGHIYAWLVVEPGTEYGDLVLAAYDKEENAHKYANLESNVEAECYVVGPVEIIQKVLF